MFSLPATAKSPKNSAPTDYPTFSRRVGHLS